MSRCYLFLDPAGETSREAGLEATKAFQRRRRRRRRNNIGGSEVTRFTDVDRRPKSRREAARLQACGDEVARMGQPVHDRLQEE